MSDDDRADDAAFVAAFAKLNSADETARARAWSDALTWCYDHGDRHAYGMVLGAFSDGVRNGPMPPPAALHSLCLMFDAFQAGATFDEAFGMRQPRRGKPPSLKERMAARSRANMVWLWVREGMSPEQAAQQVEESLNSTPQAKSATQIERDFNRYARARKANKRT